MAAMSYALEKLQKMLQNIVLQHKTFQVMFYRQHRHDRSLWYHFSNFEHFLRAEIMMTSLASSYERK